MQLFDQLRIMQLPIMDGKCWGFAKEQQGLINRPLEYVSLTIEQCDSAVLRSGGTLLGSTNKDNPFKFPNADGTRTDRSDDFIEGYQELGLDALIGIGGDGSMHILSSAGPKRQSQLDHHSQNN